MYDIASVRAALKAKPEAEETFPFGPEPLVMKVGGKIFALLSLTDLPVNLSLKCDPDRGEFLRAEFPAITPGYHLNKRHWITLKIDETLDPGLVQDLIDDSYRLVVKSLTRAARTKLGLV